MIRTFGFIQYRELISIMIPSQTKNNDISLQKKKKPKQNKTKQKTGEEKKSNNIYRCQIFLILQMQNQRDATKFAF